MPALRDLALMIQSRYPFIAVDTSEEDRETFFVDLPNAEERREIFAIHLRKRKRDPRLFDLALHSLLARRGVGRSRGNVCRRWLATAAPQR
jgi:SpoVK/Ycf46/Vps4 family AAA+-type ATPase